MARAENLLIARRLQELGRDFGALRTKFASAFVEREKALARLDRTPAQIGKWSGTSFCDVLAQITGDLVTLLDHQVHPPAHYMESVILAERLKALNRDDWKALDIAVRKEAAAVEDGPPPARGTAGQKTPSEQDQWRPSAHQESVLSVLKRDGRLRTGVLWERISPKHIGERAHQNAMSDLVAHDRVLTAGKGRATEFWLP
ncbi:MAG TPA: hypothetical protein VF128_15350 [Gemmatimonadaceae bacterium]